MLFALKLNGLDVDLAARIGRTLRDEAGHEFDLAALLDQAVIELPSPRIFMDAETLEALRNQAKGGPHPPGAAEEMRKLFLQMKFDVGSEEIEKKVSEFIAEGIKPNLAFKDGDLPTYRGILIVIREAANAHG